ncbi:MAG: ATP synthase F0 subunit B [Deltaproteobacteria bacterium]|nr:ATP synthase F0 subunit B [Deltaproteobacteria bacterium]MBW2071738.1 ATP synthase F0 subunit B [Deltaproteobacteria bacterium]
MINVNVTLLIQMVNFLILLYILNLILFRPIRGIIKERNQVVDTFNSDITTMTNQAQEAMEQFQQKIIEARKEGLAKVQSMKEEGQAVEAQLLDESSRQAHERTEEIRAQIAKEIEEARERLQEQVQVFSLAVAEKILGRSIQ